MPAYYQAVEVVHKPRNKCEVGTFYFRGHLKTTWTGRDGWVVSQYCYKVNDKTAWDLF